MATRRTGAVVLGAMVALALSEGIGEGAEETRFAQTNSRSEYVHWIDLYDADKKKIDPGDPKSPPYSPAATCGKCHEDETIAQGYHFNAMGGKGAGGRSGEPWVWTDMRTGTQIPLSYRGWEGLYEPGLAGISAWQFALKFGRHIPGGMPDGRAAGKTDGGAGQALEGRWRLAGRLEIDCMFCHTNDRSYSPEVWAEQVAAENFAWAATAAMGLAEIRGRVSRLEDDFNPAAAAADGEDGLPRTLYRPEKFNAEKKVFFDVVREPSNNVCYYCHTVREVGGDVSPEWTRDEDVHIEAGLSCVDCHRNGLDHHTVRGFENERHPAGVPVGDFSCRGCHMDEAPERGEAVSRGRLGAPKALHKGLPPLHLEKMSCTSCHAGPMPRRQAGVLQTSMAHELGLRAHSREGLAPTIVSPVLMRNEAGVLYPYRMMWPAFWGMLKNDEIVPVNPEEANNKLRRVLRVRRDFGQEMGKVELSKEDKAAVLGQQRAAVAESELSAQEKSKLDETARAKAGEAFREKLAQALKTLSEGDKEAAAVYVSGGKAYRLGSDGKVELFNHPAAEPYVWPLAHDVRPARQSLGARGCAECHAEGAPIFYGTVTAKGPAPDDQPETSVMYTLQGLDAQLLAAWNRSFLGRDAFKWAGFVSIGAVAVVLLLFLLLGLNGLFKFTRRRPTA